MTQPLYFRTRRAQFACHDLTIGKYPKGEAFHHHSFITSSKIVNYTASLAGTDLNQPTTKKKEKRMNENDSNEINLNGVIYVRKDSITETKPVNTEGMPYVICRGHECGVHAGYIKNHDGNHATLVKSRRLWYWKAKEGISLSAVAKHGIAADVKLPNELDEIWLGDVYEIIPCTQEAMESIAKAGICEQS